MHKQIYSIIGIRCVNFPAASPAHPAVPKPMAPLVSSSRVAVSMNLLPFTSHTFICRLIARTAWYRNLDNSLLWQETALARIMIKDVISLRGNVITYTS